MFQCVCSCICVCWCTCVHAYVKGCESLGSLFPLDDSELDTDTGPEESQQLADRTLPLGGVRSGMVSVMLCFLHCEYAHDASEISISPTSAQLSRQKKS
ncbi:hypothetical protein ScPMuIL_002112 [Solemya velum]